MTFSKFKTILFPFCLFILFHASAQNPSDVINPKSINFQLVDKLFNQKLNELRKSKNASELTSDNILVKASNDQAEYMAKNDTLTHFQTVPNKRTPQDRVRFYSGTNDGVGENCLYTYLFKPIIKNKKNKKDTITKHASQQEKSLTDAPEESFSDTIPILQTSRPLREHFKQAN